MKALLLLLSAGKLGKVALSAGSMLLSLGTYALLYGWKYAAGFVLMLLLHELGHYLVARKHGLDVGLPTFIPFVGAWIALKEQPMDAQTEASIGIAGPMLGSAAAFVCYLMAQDTGALWLFAIAYAGFMLNLFNLIPLSPLDGGRIMAAISPRLWLLGLPVLAGVFFWQPSPMIIVIGVLALPQVWAALTRRDLTDSAYYRVSTGTRLSYSVQYLVLVVALLMFSFETHEHLTAVRG